MPFEPIPLSPYRTPKKPAMEWPKSYVDLMETSLAEHKSGHAAAIDSGIPVPFMVHRTDFPPHETEDGYAIGSTFYERGGLGQEMDTQAHNAVNVHFSVQGSVTDHIHGQWADRKYTVYAPLIPALARNGLPETFLTADTAFVSTDQPVHLPGSVLVEDVPAQDLGSEFIQTAKGGHVLMANEVNHQNADAVLRQIQKMRTKWSQRQSEVLDTLVDKLRSGRFSEVDINLVRDIVGANTLNTAPEFYFGNKGKDGFIPLDHNVRIADMISAHFPDSSGFKVGCGLHTGGAGDKLRHPERLSKNELLEIASSTDVHPALKEIAEKWANSDLHAKLRRGAILNGFREKGMVAGLGPEGTQTHFSAFLGSDGSSSLIERSGERVVPYGIITQQEARDIFRYHMTPTEREGIMDYISNSKDAHSSPSAVAHTTVLLSALTEMHQSACVQEMHDSAKAAEKERQASGLKH